jgi:hypothetical protein
LQPVGIGRARHIETEPVILDNESIHVVAIAIGPQIHRHHAQRETLSVENKKKVCDTMSISIGQYLLARLSDGNYDNMLNCYREFTLAQARIEPANARQEIDRVLRTCWIEKRPVYLQLPSDVAGARTESIAAPLDLDFPPSDPMQLARAIARVFDRLSQASAPLHFSWTLMRNGLT